MNVPSRSACLFIVAVVLILANDAQAASVGKQWSEPINLGSINSTANEQNVFLSNDELTIYFTSNRPGPPKDLDIYVAKRASVFSDWQDPVKLPAPLNSAANDFGPNLSPDGHLLFFASARAGGFGGPDIYVSRRVDTTDDFAWETPVNIGAPINTSDAEQAPFYMQHGDAGPGTLYFNRGLQLGQHADLYYGSVTREGMATGEVVSLDKLNSSVNDFAITITQDGREAIFTSQRPAGGAGHLWISTRRSSHDEWGTPVKADAPLNSDATDVTPHFSANGLSLIFASTRAGGHGGNDLWMSTRLPSGQ